MPNEIARLSSFRRRRTEAAYRREHRPDGGARGWLRGKERQRPRDERTTTRKGDRR